MLSSYLLRRKELISTYLFRALLVLSFTCTSAVSHLAWGLSINYMSDNSIHITEQILTKFGTLE